MNCQHQTQYRIELNEPSKTAQLRSLQSKASEGNSEEELDPIQCYFTFQNDWDLRKGEPNEETSGIHLYEKYSSPSTPFLNLHIHVSQQLNHVNLDISETRHC